MTLTDRFDPASLEILRKLGEIMAAQSDLAQVLQTGGSPAPRQEHGTPVGSSGPWSAPVAPVTPVPVPSYGAAVVADYRPSASEVRIAAAALDAALEDMPAHPGGSFPLDLGSAADADALAAVDVDGVNAVDSSEFLSGEAATARWVELLASDADGALDFGFLADQGQELDGPDAPGGRDAHRSRDDDLETVSSPDGMTPLQQATKMADDWQDGGEATTVASVTSDQQRRAEERLWRTANAIELLPQERFYFENFLDRLSKWVRARRRCSFGGCVHCLTYRSTSLTAWSVSRVLFRTWQYVSPSLRRLLCPVVQRAHKQLHNAGLLNAIFALSCRHLSLNPRLAPDATPPDRSVALQYYYQTLHYVQKAMRFRSYQTSLELLATTLIVSTYEMVDGCRKAWERHLEGACWILRAQITEVETPDDFKSAVWWAWLRQDVWAAFSETRRAFTDWVPVRPYAALTPYELASRVVWIWAQVVNFAADADAVDSAVDAAESAPDAATAFRHRLQRARELHAMLHAWRAHLTAEFEPLPIASSDSHVFQPLCVRPACLGVALQVYHAAQILLRANAPTTGSLAAFRQRQAIIQESVRAVGGLAMALTDDASSLVSSQCLFVAGLFTHDRAQAEVILGLLAACEARTGWTPRFHGEELGAILGLPGPMPG